MGYITLLSDFGLQDASVAIAKGILMQRTRDLGILDITHEVAPFNTAQAAYLLGAAYKKFPPGTFHVIPFDLFSGPLSLILTRHAGHYFLSADNGLIPLALGIIPVNVWQCTIFKQSATYTDWLEAVSDTITSLQNSSETHGLPSYQFNNTIRANSTAHEVIHVDHYENVVVNMTRQQFESQAGGRQFSIRFMHVEEINEISNNYSDVREGFKLCRFNGNNYLEICINRGKAASLFGLRLGSKNNNIKISFE